MRLFAFNQRLWTMLALVLPLLSGVAGTQAAAADNCTDPDFHWSVSLPSVNLQHVFCGELIRGNPKGAHSQAILGTSAVVAAVSPSINCNLGPQTEFANGTYNAQVCFVNGTSKQSTFFPDACSVDQIVKSILYAVDNTTGPAKPWGILGPSAPSDGDVSTYCLGSDGKPFTIRTAQPIDNTVNTAFPHN